MGAYYCTECLRMHTAGTGCKPDTVVMVESAEVDRLQQALAAERAWGG
jgi:hypothetical protein